jgi:predicted nucleic acid-binding protein
VVIAFARISRIWSEYGINEGLAAYDAAYVAVAEQTGARLITDDREILRVAPDLSGPLADN